jgi:hypothetical protein
MSARRIILAPALLCAMVGGAGAAVPTTLACVNEAHLNWTDTPPALIAVEDALNGDIGGSIIHLDPTTGEWHLEVEGSAALVNDGGTFEVGHGASLERYSHEWVGVDGDTVLRIRGGDAPWRFVLVSRDQGIMLGTCTEPAEPFLLLRGGDGPL